MAETTTEVPVDIPGAKLVKGIWFPEHDRHLTGMVMDHSKVGEVRLGDGRIVGTYQKHKLDYAMTLLPANRRRQAVDVGAHIGLWSMHLVDLFQKVDAFEPITEFCQLFEANMNGNPRANLHRVGLGSKKGTLNLCVDPINTGNTHAVGSDEGKEQEIAEYERERVGIDFAEDDTDSPLRVRLEEVPVQTLDSFNFENVDLIKIDVEGVELDVVKGARRTLMRCSPMVIVEQKGNDSKFHGGSRDAASNYLVNLGMKLLKNYGGDHILDWPK